MEAAAMAAMRIGGRRIGSSGGGSSTISSTRPSPTPAAAARRSARSRASRTAATPASARAAAASGLVSRKPPRRSASPAAPATASTTPGARHVPDGQLECVGRSVVDDAVVLAVEVRGHGEPLRLEVLLGEPGPPGRGDDRLRPRGDGCERVAG